MLWSGYSQEDAGGLFDHRHSRWEAAQGDPKLPNGHTRPPAAARLDCTHVAMEATGVYWKPIYNILEGHFELLVVNAQHIKAVPGHKVRHEVA